MSAVLLFALLYVGASLVLGLPLAVLLGRGIRLADARRVRPEPAPELESAA